MSIVPFGKYKGQPVEVMAQDRQYCEWLASQEWFRTRFTAIHTLIINNFTEPSETPEHNALQVMFTDDTFVRKFLHACCSHHYKKARENKLEILSWSQSYTKERASEQREPLLRNVTYALKRLEEAQERERQDPGGVERERVRRAGYDERKQKNEEEIANWENWDASDKLRGIFRGPRPSSWSWNYTSEDYSLTRYEQEFNIETNKLQEADAKLKTKIDQYQQAIHTVTTRILSPTDFIYSTYFEEKGVDVFIKGHIDWLVYGLNPHEQKSEWGLSIECKPSVGDDYPAILRDMRKKQCNILFIGHGGYTGTGATLDQVKTIYASAAITIKLLSDIQ